MATTTYAPEYSAENIASLVNQYSKTLEPEYQKSLRNVKASTFGQGLGFGTPYQAGIGEVEAGRNTNLANYSLGLQQQGLAAEASGRESALQRAYGTSERLGSQDFTSQQNALSRALQEAGLTGVYQGQKTLAGTEAAQQQGVATNEDTIAKNLGYSNATEMNLATPAEKAERLRAYNGGVGTTINLDTLGIAPIGYGQTVVIAGKTFKRLGDQSNVVTRVA